MKDKYSKIFSGTLFRADFSYVKWITRFSDVLVPEGVVMLPRSPEDLNRPHYTFINGDREHIRDILYFHNEKSVIRRYFTCDLYLIPRSYGVYISRFDP